MSKKQEAKASFKECGGEPLVNGSESLLGSMRGNVGLELTSLINSGLTWKKVAKGNRTSTRRARNTFIRSLKAGDELINKDSNIVDMTVSESEKLGVSVLGCRFSEKAEHVPIKKRKFMFRSPSPPPRGPSLCCKETHIPLESVDCTASTSDLGQIVDTENDIDDKILVRVKKQLDENDDFSGISLLAATACSTSFGGGDDHVEQGSGVEGSLMHEVPSINESCSLLKRVPKEDLSSAEISTEGTGSSISGVPAEELAASLRMDYSSTNSVSLASKEHNESMQYHAVATLKDVLTKKNEEADGVHGFSSRDRLHWDLNTSMDAWECPFDDQWAESHADVANDESKDVKDGSYINKMRSFEDEAVQGVPGGKSCHVKKDIPPAESREIAYKEVSQIEEFKSHSCINTEKASSGCADIVSADTACASTDGDKSAVHHSSTFGTGGNSGNLSPHQVVGLDSCVDNLVTPKTSRTLSTSVSESAVCDLVSTETKCMQNEVGCAGEDVSTGAQVKEKIVPHIASSDNTTSETQCALNEGGENFNKVAESANEVADMLGNSNVPNDFQPLKSKRVDDVKENSLCQSDGVGSLPSCPMVQEVPASPVLALDSMVKHDNGHTTDIGNLAPVEIEENSNLPDSSMQLLHSPLGFGSCKPCRNHSENPVNSADKIASEEPLENGYDSDVSHDDEASVKGIGFEGGYDSQYEDGEVRGSIEHVWEEYDGEDMEVEHVDYGSDNVNLGSEPEQIMTNTEGTDAQPCPSTLKGKDVSSDIETADDIHNNSKVEPNRGIKYGGTGAEEDTVGTGASNDSSRKNINDDSTGGLEAEKQTRVVEFRSIRSGLRSCIEGRTYHDVSFRKDSDADASNPQSELEPRHIESYGRGRYTQHAYARGRGGDRRVDYRDSNRGIKRHHSPNYHGSIPFRHHGPENLVHQRLTRCRSPNDTEEGFGMRMRLRPSRDWSPGRRVTLGRGRSVRCGLRVDERSPQVRYHGPVPDDCTGSPLKHPHPSVKRERSFSPVERRVHPVHRFNSKFSSRSRSRSPNSVNPCFRRDQQSKSPIFRNEIRMQRGRSPYLRPSVLSDRMGGFRPTQRCHGSPPHNARWIGDRKDGVAHFREQGYDQRSFLDKRSPVRFLPRDDRFGRLRSMHPGRFTDGGVGRGGLRYEGSDEAGRFTDVVGGVSRGGLRYEGSDDTGRFTEMDGGVGRGGLRYEGSDDAGRFTEMDGGVGRGGLRYEGSDEDKGKHGYRFGVVHPVKRYDMDGPGKRFGYNVDDDFVPTRSNDDKGKHGYRFGVVHPVKRYDMDGPGKRFRYVEDSFVPARNSRYRGAPQFHGRGSPKDHSRVY